MSNEVEYTGTEEERDVPRNVKVVRFHSNVTEVSNDMFKGCKQLKKVVLNEGLKKIGDYAFHESYQLEHINLPSTVTDIGEGAFSECCNLKGLRSNEGLNRIRTHSFSYCSKLERG